MTGTRDWLTRERGSRDWRLLPAAICGWAASLAAHAGFAYCMSHDGMLGALPAVLTCMIPLRSWRDCPSHDCRRPFDDG